MQETSDKNLTHMGKMIQKHRIQRNWSQQELADLCSISLSTLRRAKTESDSMRLDTVVRFADLFGISLDELVGRDGYRMFSEADRVTISSLEFRLAEQTRTIESQQHTVELLEKEIAGNNRLIASQDSTIEAQRKSIRRNDIFRNCLLGAFVLAVFVLWFVQI